MVTPKKPAARGRANPVHVLGWAALSALVACARSSGGGFSQAGGDGGRQDDSGPGMFGARGGPGDGGFLMFEGGAGAGGGLPASDPVTCAQAAESKAYVGCDYWPTVVANNVWSIFDFAVVVANGQATSASVTVTGPNGVNRSASVAPGSLTKIFLPWVQDLKGPDIDNCGQEVPLAASIYSAKGAYHLVSSVPVSVYQFNALEYRGKGGPAGKDWSACPGNTFCQSASQAIGCSSFSNDASLLLPSTAMTGNYRVMGIHGWSGNDVIAGPYDIQGSYFALTATQDDTTVAVKISATGQTVAGGAIPATGPNQILHLTMQQGDVAEVVSPIGQKYDFSGSQVAADKPVQVISGIPCIKLPADVDACDHVEQSVFPAETLGKDYFVTAPTGPRANVVGHVVRLFGNVDGTVLTYAPSAPPGCPASLGAGQVADCGVVTSDFEVTGNHEFGVGMFMLGAADVDPGTDPTQVEGDPSQSFAVAVEQYRTKYIFLAPDDYDFSFADVVGPAGVTVTLDGAPVTAAFTPVGSTGYGVARITLGPGQSGAHVMTSTRPAGLQVLGYGVGTSYQYPGGLNLQLVAPPPPPPQ